MVHGSGETGNGDECYAYCQKPVLDIPPPSSFEGFLVELLSENEVKVRNWAFKSQNINQQYTIDKKLLKRVTWKFSTPL